MKRFFRILFKTIHVLLILGGLVFFTAIIFSYTVWPYRWESRLAAAKRHTPKNTQYIVLLGGGGIPSESSLIRTYHAARAAQQFPEAKVIIALPDKLDEKNNSIQRMAKELEMRGVNKNRILFEDKGTNTRAQAIYIREKYFPHSTSVPLLIVTSPYHMFRAVSVFEKLGFSNVGGYPAFEKANSKNSTYSPDKVGGNKYIPDIDKQPGIRYSMWSGLQKEILVLREHTAIQYYKLKGWM